MVDARQVFDRLTDSMNRHDAHQAATCYADEVVIVAPEGSSEGREQAELYLSSFLRSFPDMTVTSWSKISSGDLVVDEWSLTGTNTGPVELPDGRTAPPTGKPVTLRGCDVGTVADGQIISHRLYYDQLDLLTQLGLLQEAIR